MVSKACGPPDMTTDAATEDDTAKFVVNSVGSSITLSSSLKSASAAIASVVAVHPPAEHPAAMICSADMPKR